MTVRGKASHAGVNPEGGANAILGGSHVLQAIENYAEELQQEESDIHGIGSQTCVPATIGGGVKTNVVPAECWFTVDHCVPPDYDGGEIERHFGTAVEEASLPEGGTVDVDVALRAEPYISNPEDEHVRVAKENAKAVFGHEFDLVGIRGFSNGRFFAEAGAKTLNFGPSDSSSNPHGSDENISLEQIHDAGPTVAASVIDLVRL